LHPGTVEALNYFEICETGRQYIDFNNIKEDTLGIFFCKVANEFPFDKQYNIDNVDNKVILSGYHNDNKLYKLDWIYQRVDLRGPFMGLFKRYESKNEVYKYLKTFSNLKMEDSTVPNR
jgi:hypothetical protein